MNKGNNNLDKIAINSLLYDFYGNLLTERQKMIMLLYHEENLSLSEISSELNISRQGVHDALKKSEKVLEEYEGKLGLVAKFINSEKAINEIDNKIEEIQKYLYSEKEIDINIAKKKIEEIRKIISEINN